MSNKLINKLKVEKRPTCSLCGKSFPSHKSLCGHMRWHPGRDYRGLRPPDALKFVTTRSQSLMAVDDDDIDRMDVLSGWSMIEKGAVYALVQMATGNDCYRYLDNDKIEDELDKLQKLSISNKKPRLVHGSTSDDQEQNCSADSANNKFKPDPSGIESDTTGKKRKRQTAKVKDSELSDNQINNQADAAAASKSYECSICEKTFATHQALGGHKSSAHSKQGIDGGFVSSQPPCPPSAADTTVSEVGHICKTCDKAFPSGQALGGHMRRHWPGPALLGSSTTTSEAKPVLVFYLNQPVADDTKEQE